MKTREEISNEISKVHSEWKETKITVNFRVDLHNIVIEIEELIPNQSKTLIDQFDLVKNDCLNFPIDSEKDINHLVHGASSLALFVVE